ncbi:Elongin-B-like 1 [Homarus americanus]|uniref:Elongin-B-like 1 n=1 Tax=Homarus americanus TaxID=6706 RepID=A0A8J5JXH1_HOMAM|nr:Elongin-B-like 1 [Homarus americanus]
MIADVFLMVRRKKTTIFTDAKETTTVRELKKIIQGNKKNSMNIAENAIKCLPIQLDSSSIKLILISSESHLEIKGPKKMQKHNHSKLITATANNDHDDVEQPPAEKSEASASTKVESVKYVESELSPCYVRKKQAPPKFDISVEYSKDILGVFHTSSAYWGAIWKSMEGSGAEHIVIRSDLCTSGSINKVLSGKH